jgi:hypothetical protein
MKRITRAQEILEQCGTAGRPDELLNEEMGTSINSFLTAQNKIPKTYRDREITLGSQILLWLWMRNRFDELEKKLEQQIKALKPKEKGVVPLAET